MCLPVSGQVTGGAVTLATVRAAVCFGLKQDACVSLRNNNSESISSSSVLSFYCLKMHIELIQV